jgi:Putative transposase
LLPVEYFHVTFTLPSQVAPLALHNQRVVYNLLFKAVSQTLLKIAADPRHLGAQIGFFAVLHTWGQTLQHHPHIHCVVPGGGLSSDCKSWVSCKPGFFLPVRVLSRLFRRLFLDGLRKEFDLGHLEFHQPLQHLADPVAFSTFVEQAQAVEWVVHSKSHCSDPERALDYLSHYTHKVALSNHRLVRMEDDTVTFAYKDYRDGDKSKQMTILADEFIRRFLLHILPDGFMRIRYYGLLCNQLRDQKLSLCRCLLGVHHTSQSVQQEPEQQDPDFATRYRHLTGKEVNRCPVCKQGTMIRVQIIPPLAGNPITPSRRAIPGAPNTS